MVKIISTEKKLHNGVEITEFKLSAGMYTVKSRLTSHEFQVEKFCLVGVREGNPILNAEMGSEYAGEIALLAEKQEEYQDKAHKYHFIHHVVFGYLPPNGEFPVAFTNVRNVIIYRDTGELQVLKISTKEK